MRRPLAARNCTSTGPESRIDPFEAQESRNVVRPLFGPGRVLVRRHLRGKALVDTVLSSLCNRLIQSRAGLEVAILPEQNQNEVPPRFEEGWIEVHRLADQQLGFAELPLSGERRSIVVQEGRNQTGVAAQGDGAIVEIEGALEVPAPQESLGQRLSGERAARVCSHSGLRFGYGLGGPVQLDQEQGIVIVTSRLV